MTNSDYEIPSRANPTNAAIADVVVADTVARDSFVLCASITSEFPVNVRGRVVSRAEWWSSGGGAMVAIGVALFSGQIAAVIFRFKQSRSYIAGAWILFALTELTLGSVTTYEFTGTMADSWVLVSGMSAFIRVVAYLVAAFAPYPRDFLA